MRTNKGFLSLFSGVLLFAALFLFPDTFASGVSAGIELCGKILIPSLFPFLIAASLTGKGSLPPKLKKTIEPVTRFLFDLPADCLPAILLGQLGGYLSGAKTVQSLHSCKAISDSQAERLMLFCVNAGMGFSVNAVGSGMLNSRQAGRILLLALCISSLMLGIASRVFIKEKPVSIQKSNSISIPFSAAVTGSVSSAAKAMLTACAFAIAFSALGAISDAYIQNSSLRLALSCLLEVTKGCADLSGSASLPLIAAVCAFGGICVHMQIFAVTDKIKINIPRFYLFRLLHAALAYAACKIILYFYPVTLSASVVFYSNARLFSFSAPAAISLLFLCALLILDLDNSKKIC